MTPDEDERAFRALTQQIAGARGFSCEAYKDKCLKRRIAVRMRACGVHTYDAYAGLLSRDAKEYEHLLDALTINVTKFYRNAETWDALRPLVTAAWKERQGQYAAWSAGCASGEEPYTIAALLADIARGAGREAQLERTRVDASDIDRASLERTATAQYADAAFVEMPKAMTDRYFTKPPPREPVPLIKQLVHVARNDLLKERPPRAPYDLIVCRNVVIYFDRPSQEKLFIRFAEALRPGGIMVLGKVETLFGDSRDLLELQDPRERIYRRPA
ncbi:MAG TPA: protein-glutamate O-methyltransferase CheR [Gemmatimonadales bacterium]|nr:protein-glutamate O-methyltransferase CheR [Gemmatimonadales bacterium]